MQRKLKTRSVVPYDRPGGNSKKNPDAEDLTSKGPFLGEDEGDADMGIGSWLHTLEIVCLPIHFALTLWMRCNTATHSENGDLAKEIAFQAISLPNSVNQVVN